MSRFRRATLALALLSAPPTLDAQVEDDTTSLPEIVVTATRYPVAADSVQSPQSYRIQRGDTLSTIARKFGVSVEDLRLWNGMDSDRIHAGQSITIHPAGGSQ